MDVDERTAELKAKRICRFCMSQDDKLLSNIYSRENRLKNSVPLPLQIMACVSIEVFTNDQMPSTICEPCRNVMDHCYRFKQICKKSDTMLKQFPLTGIWPERLELPKFMSETKLIPSPQKQEKSPVPTIQKFKRPAEASPTSTTPKRSREDIVISSIQIKPARSQTPQQPKGPKLLNKSAPKILNKNAVAAMQQQQYDPVIKTDEEGNVEIITEMFDNSQMQYEEPDPVKFATPVETNVFPCDKCERSFPLKQLLDIHYANHTRERSFECNICEKRFFSKYDLGKHMLIHTGEKPFECVVCAKRFSRSTLLYRHEKIHTDQPKFLCAHCERPFLSELELEKHSETHKKSRPFQCKYCNKGFAFKQGLERHETTHSKVQPFPCEYCEKSFPTSSKLARHLTAHAGERPYPCKLCPKSFLLSHHLSRHLRSHGAGTGSYKCNDCDNIFATRDDLIYHSAVHATQNLTCPLCKEQFEDIDSVTEHIKSHCDGEQFACDYCDLIFITEDKREEHCSEEHAEDHKGNELGYRIENAVIENHLEGESIDEYVIEEVGKNIRQYVKKGVQVKSQQARAQTDDSRRSTRIAHSQVIKTEVGVVQKEEIEDGEKEENIEFILCDGNSDGNRQIEIDEQEDDEEVDYDEEEEVEDEEIEDSDEDFVLKKTPPKKIVEKKSTQVLVSKFINSTQTQKKSISPEKPKAAAVPVRKSNEAVQKVIKNLPKGVTISKKETITEQLPVETKKEKASPVTKPLPTKKPQATYAKRPQQQQPSTSADAIITKKKIISPHQPIKKEINLEDPLKPQTKLIEMKIGDKMVKVQKIVMTKSQVAAMTKKGKIEMKDGAMILKQSSKSRRSADGDDD